MENRYIKFIPTYRHHTNKNNRLTRAYSYAVELIMNSFGRAVRVPLYMGEKNSHSDDYLNRGDVDHRYGGIMSDSQFDALIESSQEHIDRYLLKYPDMSALLKNSAKKDIDTLDKEAFGENKLRGFIANEHAIQ